MKKQIIALVDCDSFFVSCEQSINKALQGKPVCVLSNNDSCVVARSKEAKKLGVSMGMTYYRAKREFPNVVYLSGNLDIYRKFSKKVMGILKDFSPDLQVYSIDEAFLELSGVKNCHNLNYYKLAKKIRDTVKNELDINVSVGVSTTKVLAKFACEKAKKSDGIYLIGKNKIKKELSGTPVEEIWGIGKNISKLLRRFGILTCDELVKMTDAQLEAKLGKRGFELKHELLGECFDYVINVEKMPKSIQNTRTFPKNSSDKNYIKNWLNKHIHTSCARLRQLNGTCKAVGIILKTSDFTYYNQKINLKESTNFELDISREVMKMFDIIFNSDLVYRSCGVTLEKLEYNSQSQLNLFGDAKSKDCTKLADALDKLEKKFGRNVVKTGFLDDENL